MYPGSLSVTTLAHIYSHWNTRDMSTTSELAYLAPPLTLTAITDELERQIPDSFLQDVPPFTYTHTLSISIAKICKKRACNVSRKNTITGSIFAPGYPALPAGGMKFYLPKTAQPAHWACFSMIMILGKNTTFEKKH